jgi:hypothetical protein
MGGYSTHCNHIAEKRNNIVQRSLNYPVQMVRKFFNYNSIFLLEEMGKHFESKTMW